jgi:DNA-directed RNA polymerase specialized sigma24 family protein
MTQRGRGTGRGHDAAKTADIAFSEPAGRAGIDLPDCVDDDADSTGEPHQPAARRRQGDLDLVAALADTGFTGPNWDRFANELARYGHAVVLAWLRTGEMFAQCVRRHRRLSPPPVWWCEEDRITLADDTVFQGILDFRERGLRGGQWRPDGGASLRTYFVGSCVLAFPNVYRRWRTEGEASRQAALAARPVDVIEDRALPDDPCELAVRELHLADCLAGVPDERTRQAILYQEFGYSLKEIAELLAVTPGAVKQLLARQRERGSRASQNGGAHG